MRIERKCKVCGTPFTAIKTTQYFCKRKCFKRDYYVRNKRVIQLEKTLPTFPKKRCSFCSVVNSLPFDPVKHPLRFNEWECGNCGVSNKLLWEYQDNYNSYQIISNILKTVHVRSFFLEKPNLKIHASLITIVGEEPKKKDVFEVVVEKKKLPSLFSQG